MKTNLNVIFEQYKIPLAIEEYRFHHSRKWRFDYAWPEHMIALEVDGGTWAGGRHTRGHGFVADQEKLNHATLTGWEVYRTTPDGLKDGSIFVFLQEVFRRFK